MKRDASVGLIAVAVGRVVDAVVVEPAQGDRVGEVGGASERPGISVVEVAPGVGTVAAVGRAPGVPGGEGDALGLGKEPVAATEVEGE